MSDYLKDSSYGQLASSLLGQQKSSKKRDFVYSLIGGFLQNRQRKLKEEVTSSLEALNLEYDAVFKGNESRYRKADTDRALYESYQKNISKGDKNTVLVQKAIELFNKDPSIMAAGKNYSMISTFDEESKARAEELYNKYLEEAKIFFTELGETPEITALTFQDYNEPFINEYKAKYNSLKDDPAKQSLLASWADKLFPNSFDRKRAELSLAITNAEEKTKIIEDNSLNYINPNEEVEAENLSVEVSSVNSISQTNNLDTFYSQEERFKLDKDAFIKKVAEPEYVITLEDLHDAALYGVNLPGLSGFNNILASERGILFTALSKVRKNIAEGIDSLTGLNDLEKRIYFRGIGTTAEREEYEDINLKIARENLKKIEAPYRANLKTPEQYENDLQDKDYMKGKEMQIVAIVEGLVKNGNLPSSYENFLDLLDSDLYFDEKEIGRGGFLYIGEDYASDAPKQLFLQSTVRTMQELIESNPAYAGRDGYLKAIVDAVKFQLSGFQEREYGAFGGRNFSYEPTDLEFFNITNKEKLNENDANTLVYILNNKSYPQYILGEDGVTPVFSRVPGNAIEQSNYRFFYTTAGWKFEVIGD